MAPIKIQIMKIIIGILGVLVLIFAVAQVILAQTTQKIEEYPYVVVEKRDGYEIRRYESRNFTYVSMPKSDYKTNSSRGFRVLAGYIFGDNEANQKIAMTSPVTMDVSESDSMEMMFLIPAEYQIDELPNPSNRNVKFKTVPAKLVAALQFGGWSNDDKIAKHKAELETLLKRDGIQHNGNFSYFGYNPPYEVVNRRNEIIVELEPGQFE